MTYRKLVSQPIIKELKENEIKFFEIEYDTIETKDRLTSQ